MTRAEAFRLAERIAADVRRIGMAPPLMLADTYDDGQTIDCIHLFDGQTVDYIGRLDSEAAYDAILSEAMSILNQTMARA
jgi:hypothetical protein